VQLLQKCCLGMRHFWLAHLLQWISYLISIVQL
ncbi:uncharacterized protein METZ01_LOCUS375486, partial [marine metagenome]